MMVDVKQTVSGIVLFAVFWAFQNGYFASIGPAAWVVGVIVFAAIMWFIGKSMMPKANKEMSELWQFASLFAIVSTIAIAYLGPYLGAVFPPGFTPSMIAPLVLSFWLVVFGGAMVVTGLQAKWPVTTLTGIIWLFSSPHFVTALSTGPNSYLHFGLVTSLPFVLYGLMSKN